MVNEFETRDITVSDYTYARALMIQERSSIWRRYEYEGFKDDKLGELVEVYDFVIDTLTELAIELDKKSRT